jgi:uncharacterized protein (DUF1499 family)
VGQSNALKWVSLVVLVLALLAAAAMLLAGYGYRWHWWSLDVAFRMLRALAYIGVVCAVLALVTAGVCLVVRRWRLALLPLLGVLAASFAVALPLSLLSRGAAAPPIHDITTDFADPPAFVALKQLRDSAPNGATYGGSIVADQQRQAYPDLAPVVLKLAPPQALAKALLVARDMGWQIVAQDDTAMEATATTPWFGFKDDVVLRVRPDGSGSRIDIRSASRIGTSDLGANAQRVRQTIERLKN